MMLLRITYGVVSSVSADCPVDFAASVVLDVTSPPSCSRKRNSNVCSIELTQQVRFVSIKDDTVT